jgi:hypothetical protein
VLKWTIEARKKTVEMGVNMKIGVLYNTTHCNLVESCPRFAATFCLNLQCKQTVGFSEMMGYVYQNTLRHIPENSNHHF